MTSRWVAVVLMILFVFGALPASAQERTALLTDPGGDLQVEGAPSEAALPPGRYDYLDLRSLSAVEELERFVFALEVASLDQTAPVEGVESSTYEIHFVYGEKAYRIEVARHVDFVSQVYGGELSRQVNATPAYELVSSLEVVRVGPSMVVGVDRGLILDGTGAPPLPGRAAVGFWAQSYLESHSVGVGSVHEVANAADRMPDDGVGGVPLDVRLGLQQSGHATLHSTTPIRGSNGEESSFVFVVTAEHQGTVEELYEVRAVDVPSDWEVTLLDEYVLMAAGERRDLPVILSTPFSHRHGDTKTFAVEMVSQGDAENVGRVLLGIRYHTVPQPAGHHSFLWLHSRGEGSGSQVYVNAVEQDDEDGRIDVKGYPEGTSNTGPSGLPMARWAWTIPLRPSLEMGMDFNLNGTGVLVVPIEGQVDIVDGTIGGRVLHRVYDAEDGSFNETLIAELPVYGPFDEAAGATEEVEFEVVPTVGADRLPFVDGANFAIELWVESAWLQPPSYEYSMGPVVVPGGTLTLPLFEYRDDVAPHVAAQRGVVLTALGPANRAANPGDAVLFRANLANEADDARSFTLNLWGTNEEWARLHPGSSVSVAARQVEEVAVVVTVPPDAFPNSVADVILTAQAEDAAARSILRMVVQVVDAPDQPDDAADIDALLGSAEGSSPGVAAWVVVAAALLGLASGRRPSRRD